MGLKKIIILNEEDHTQVTVENSPAEYKSETFKNGRFHIKLGIHQSMEHILRNLIEEEWTGLKIFGARLATQAKIQSMISPTPIREEFFGTQGCPKKAAVDTGAKGSAPTSRRFSFFLRHR